MRQGAQPAGEADPYRAPREPAEDEVIIRRADGCGLARRSGRSGIRSWPAGDTYTYDPASSQDTARASWLAPPPDEAWLAAVDGDGAGHLSPRAEPARPRLTRGERLLHGCRGGARQGTRPGDGRALPGAGPGRPAICGIQFNAVAETNVHAIRLYEELGFTTVGVVPRAFRHPTAGLVGLRVMYRDV